MRELKRLIPFIWPQRRKFVLSCLCGLVVAALWGGNLTIIYPIMQVLLKEKTLQMYVTEELAKYRETQQSEQGQIAALQEHLNALRTSRVSQDSREFTDTVRGLSRHQDELAVATKNEWWMLKLGIVVHASWFPTTEYRTFVFIIITVVVSTFAKGVFSYWQDVLVGECSQTALAGVRKRLFRKMLQQDYQTVANEGTAGLMSRFTYDTEMMSHGLNMIGGRFIREPLKCLVCAGLAIWINWRLTLLTLLVLPLIALVFGFISKQLKRASRRMMESMTRIYRILEEAFDGFKVVTAFDTAHQHRRMFEDEYKTYYGKSMQVIRLDSVARPTLELLAVLSLFVALLPGAYLVLRHKTSIYGIPLADQPMSVEQLGVLYALLAGMLDPCRRMNASISSLRRSMTAFERVLETLDARPLIRQISEAVPLPRHSQSIEFRNLTFRYTPRGDAEPRGPVLNGLNLKVKAGEVVAIVGQNGCGKSTLVQLLPRFFDPQAGDILIDGVSIQNVRIPALRSQIGLVTQETILFDMTLRENITYGSRDVEQSRFDAAVKMAHLQPILDQLPQGFETPLGSHGKSLSGGQRQRVALARAILRDPAILILDEATSAADAESETLIHETLQEFVKGRTVLLITHSMSQSLLDFVTRVVVMDQGQVVADGTHAQLLAVSPLYQRLFQAPSRREAA